MILDRNIMDLGDSEELLDTNVLGTIMDGEFRFREGTWRGLQNVAFWGAFALT
ncbi:hypothetical protein QO034_21990 [Sedimentitalea sp. JM2-8]|uniref:Uncharacterized protein n=1 Tax=Sedimentitalea xiamensis TaxID=3050037 RepID=A0ABT7FKR7_9RHOB|nr:hypothetical protein [Sedimentitalea xiamensis]MDK3075739.1 hypothetical protein [Sedimentitalea xiamensis]